MSRTRRTPHPVSQLFIFPHSLSAAITVRLLSSTPSILCYAFPCHPCHRFYPTCYPPVISGAQVVSLTRRSSSSSGSRALRSPTARAAASLPYPSLPFTAHHGVDAMSTSYVPMAFRDVPAPTGSRLIRPVVRLHRPAQRAVVPHACPGPRILVHPSSSTPSTSAAARTPSLSLALAILPPARSITDRSAPVLPPPPSILYRACCVCASTMPPSLCPCYNTHCVLALSRLRPSRLRLRPIPSRSITTP
ncbi:hypothetical protein BKA62DRAFT_719454 [Auriculariales sp. MPI-PUGE-AT-0066]|nr:hypothetical protein BKA62DRAFT_719454 [Auriculariales sp. MPI-PUGE-AT-0066]